MKITKTLLCLSLTIDKRYCKHSIIIPFTCETFRNQYINFKRLVITDCVTNNNNDIDDSLFQLVDSLHLTICQVYVPTEQLRQRSVTTFMECYHKHIKTQLKTDPLYVDIRGIGLLRGANYSKANVIYAKVKSKRLQSITTNIIDEYSRAGLLNETDNYRKYKKPHITLMNTEFRHKYWQKYYLFNLKVNDLDESLNKLKLGRKKPFNSTTIFEKFGDFVFCDRLLVDNIQISLKNVYLINFLMSYDHYKIDLPINNNYNQLFLSSL